jgi:hypothetical protein
MIFRSLTIATLIFLMQASRTPEVPVGVLVGLHRDDSANDVASGGSLRTLWIPVNPAAGSPREVVAIPDLLIPRKTGFWRAGLLGTCEDFPLGFDSPPKRFGRSVADYLWAAPVGTRPEVSLHSTEPVGPCGTPPATNCENDGRTIVYWVWPEYVSLNTSERVECGVHPDVGLNHSVRSLDSLDQPVTVRAALGATAEATFKNAYQKAEREFRAGLPDQCEITPFESSLWHIERRFGQWKAVGLSPSHRLCGYGFDFEADLDFSPVTGRKDDPHLSPSGSWVLVETPRLMILPSAKSDKPVVTVPLANPEDVIMIEWATGRNVARWDAEARRVRAAGPAQPLVK